MIWFSCLKFLLLCNISRAYQLINLSLQTNWCNSYYMYRYIFWERRVNMLLWAGIPCIGPVAPEAGVKIISVRFVETEHLWRTSVKILQSRRISLNEELGVFHCHVFFKVQNGVNRLNLIRGKIECQVLS